MKLRAVILGFATFALTAAAQAGSPVSFKRPDLSGLLPLLTGGSTDAFAGALRGFLVRSMPDPLYEASPNWGNTSRVARGVTWHGVRPEVTYVPKNDGKWRHIKATAINPADNLVFDIRDMQQPEPGRVTFTVFTAFDARIEYDQQTWAGGVKLYDGSARARFRAKTKLQCEALFRLEPGSTLLPDGVFRLHVVHSEVGYEHFVTEHAAGVGGEAAKVLGDAIKGGLEKWHPGIERNLFAKANASIEKAADTKEVRISLTDLLKKKGWFTVPTTPPLPAAPPSALPTPSSNP